MVKSKILPGSWKKLCRCFFETHLKFIKSSSTWRNVLIRFCIFFANIIKDKKGIFESCKNAKALFKNTGENRKKHNWINKSYQNYTIQIEKLNRSVPNVCIR
jgi:hypothetical protein